MKILLIKIGEVEEPNLPSDIPIGHIVDGDFVDFPRVGYPLYLGSNYRTSLVKKVHGFNIFETQNSIYKILPAGQVYFNNREISLELLKDSEPRFGLLKVVQKQMANEILNSLSEEEFNSLFNVKVLDPFSPEGTLILMDPMNPLCMTYDRLEAEKKIRIEMSLNVDNGNLEK